MSFCSYNPWNLISRASNVHRQTNPDFTADDFLAFYPQFTDKLEDAILDSFIAMATTVVQEARWHEQWSWGMCLFIAHFATLYLMTLGSGADSTAKQVIGNAQARGLLTSKSIGDLSVGQDFATLLGDIEGWGMWKSTQYGLQFITYARMLGKAGMYIW